MKISSSRLLLRASIGVTCAAILSIVINLLANIFFGKSLNTAGYYTVVIVLGAASAVLGLLQVLPVRQQKHKEAHQQVADSPDKANEDLLSDLASALTDLSPRQRQAMLDSLGDLIEKDFQARIERLVKEQKQNYPIKVTTEIDGIPITIETPDIEKAGDIVNLMTQRIQTISALAAEKKLQQSVVRENTEIYKTEENPE